MPNRPFLNIGHRGTCAFAPENEGWLTAKFSRLLELRAQDPGPFNYPIACFRSGAATPSTSTFGTGLGVAGLKMTSSFGIRE